MVEDLNLLPECEFSGCDIDPVWHVRVHDDDEPGVAFLCDEHLLEVGHMDDYRHKLAVHGRHPDCGMPGTTWFADRCGMLIEHWDGGARLMDGSLGGVRP